MLFVIHALDKPDAHARRMANYGAHKDHIFDTMKWGIDIVMSGPLMTDDGLTPIGSHFVIEAPDRKAVEAFHHADPFFQADVWEKPTITAFVKRRG